MPRPRVRYAKFAPEKTTPPSTFEKILYLVILFVSLWIVLHPFMARAEPLKIERSGSGDRNAYCHLAGDSIAVGIAQYFPECSVSARRGAGALEIVWRTHFARFVIISAGSNNEDTPPEYLLAFLNRVRTAAGDSRVIWIEPSRYDLRMAVIVASIANSDLLARFTPGGVSGQAFVHPRCNECLARDVRELMK